ncbi:hypothetical protein [Paenibacillus sp. Leaf72]|uniref:hypothetical protein n=1 Tax=Paenibacillus sp. Leaf72 TaxID=1736234 RepID=UPI0006F39B2D|nr:hypothetical protein [Paenibacillus sp. Leaf72]KQO17557.1 hypothetical protein ASF12_02415 [Paenibacillus sp. Leaf72]
MIEITGNDISELSDIDLRSLIGLLCEADIRANGLPTAGVTWGGHQNAKDGGVDVRVELTSTIHSDSFIPRSKNCFQVKKPDMPRGAIINEMRPNGELRAVITELIDASGAYIIVSSQGSTADSALSDRKDAMQEAVSDYPNSQALKVDFYDRERIAGWVRNHPALVLWIRDKIGRPIQGWGTYGNWANSPGGIEEEYMLDGHIRLHNGSVPHSNGLSAVDGINHLREILQRPASSVRLVGLSGVGKTRLLQALFDERIGELPLNHSQVFYSDISDSPNPDPRSFAERIIASRRYSLLIVDNCPPELHSRLASVCSAIGSLVSLITVEYDVRDDLPEETEVFRLEPASSELIEKVIRARFNHISEIDSHTIAEVSGGNARIAIALARTVQKGENLSNLRDNQLFIRLFQQRNESNSNLLRVAEACSLVYSFDSQTVKGPGAELKLLGSLVGMPVRDMYEYVSELKRRELIQQRSIWKAVLPHAIANKLAQRALENIPLQNIYTVFERAGSERLLISFSRRLSYLHECDSAKQIASKWFSEDGLLGNISTLNGLGISLINNIAPINPELTLTAIEKISCQDNAKQFFSRDNAHYSVFTRILRSLAFDKDLFERSILLICRFALSEDANENNNSTRTMLKSLFYIHHSGTHATPVQRLKIISSLVESKSDDRIFLGFSLLSASLEWRHSTSHYVFEFGARSRDYGYSPENREDVRKWFKLFIDYLVSLAISNSEVASSARGLLAEKFRGLWMKVAMFDELEDAAKVLSSTGTWREGWIAVRTTIKFDNKRMDSNVLSRLNKLDVILKPITLLERSKLYALDQQGYIWAGNNENEDNKTIKDYHQVENITSSLGREVASHDDILQELLPAFLGNDGAGLYSFGKGLADGCVNPELMWQKLYQQLSLVEHSKRNFQVVCGFFSTISNINADLSEEFLDQSVTNEILAPIYPWLQTSKKITRQGLVRLKKSLELGITPISQYLSLAYEGIHPIINDSDLCELLRIISSKPKGIATSIKILHMRIRSHFKENPISDTIIEFGQELISQFSFIRESNIIEHKDYELAFLITACFTTESAQTNARVICKRLAEAFLNYDIYSMDYSYVLRTLAKIQPLAFLDSFLGNSDEFNYMIRRVFFSENTTNPISYIEDDQIIDWGEIYPETRYPIVASAIVPYQKNENNNILEWTPLALRVIANSSDPIVVLNEFKVTFRPMSWEGSRALVMQTYLSLINDLKEHENSLIRDWAHVEETVLKAEIHRGLESESKRECARNESFESTIYFGN